MCSAPKPDPLSLLRGGALLAVASVAVLSLADAFGLADWAAGNFAVAERERLAAVEAVLPVEIGAAGLVTVLFSRARNRRMPFAAHYVGI